MLMYMRISMDVMRFIFCHECHREEDNDILRRRRRKQQ